jgi:hypothetical protein
MTIARILPALAWLAVSSISARAVDRRQGGPQECVILTKDGFANRCSFSGVSLSKMAICNSAMSSRKTSLREH